MNKIDYYLILFIENLHHNLKKLNNINIIININNINKHKKLINHMTEEPALTPTPNKAKSKPKIKFKIVQPKKEINEITEINSEDQEVTEFINQLTDIEKLALKIAKEQLESSFDIKKSIGFIEWKSKINK